MSVGVEGAKRAPNRLGNSLMGGIRMFGRYRGKLEETLGVRVRISDRHGKGKIVIEYGTLEDFDRVIEMLGKK